MVFCYVLLLDYSILLKARHNELIHESKNLKQKFQNKHLKPNTLQRCQPPHPKREHPNIFLMEKGFIEATRSIVSVWTKGSLETRLGC